MQKRTRLAKRTLAALSLREAVTWSFVPKAAAELFGGGAPSLALANPIAADLSDIVRASFRAWSLRSSATHAGA